MASFWMGYYGIFSFVIRFLYGPGAILAYYIAFGVSIQHKKRFAITTILAFLGCFIIIGHTFFVYGIHRTGLWTSIIPYAVTTPVIISMGLLFDLDILLSDRPSNRDVRGMVWLNRAWMLYFALGYLGWGMQGFGLMVSDEDYESQFRLFRLISLAMGYAVLTVIGIYAAFKFNLKKEWKTMN
ncbi:hypothetical protein GCM10011318_13630 [Phaeocystidibacter marisrubri]|nr:hypothetical protein GCM10011318_13630 [Phaeocystidibacter marisrubri]